MSKKIKDIKELPEAKMLMDGVGNIYRYVKKQVNDRVFAVAFIISLTAWFLYTLSGNFTTMVTYPVKITGALVSDSTDNELEESKIYDIDCKVTGSGFGIWRSKMGSTIRINTSELQPQKSSEGNYVINVSSLEKVISNKVNGVVIDNIYSDDIVFKALTQTTKQVPITPIVNIKSSGYYMPIGDVVTDPTYITITGPIDKVNAITSVTTYPVKIESKKSSVTGELELLPIENIQFSRDVIQYYMRFARYVERKVTMPIVIQGDMFSIYEVLPETIEVTFNIAEEIYHDFKPEQIEAYIDLSEYKNSDKNMHIVQFDGLPEGVEIRNQRPSHVVVYNGGF